MSSEGPGKAPRVRKHQVSRGPYARPKPAAGPSAADKEPLIPEEPPGTAGKSSLLGSAFTAATTPLRAAASLINKARTGGYFVPSAEKPPTDRRPSSNLEEEDGKASSSSDHMQNADEAGPSKPISTTKKPKEDQEGRELSLASLPASGSAPAPAAAPAPAPAAAPARAGQLTGPTPYDGVLNKLRNGPLAAANASDVPLFRPPRSREEREAAVAAANRSRAASAPVMHSNPAFGGSAAEAAGTRAESSSPAPVFTGLGGFGSPVPGPAFSTGRRGEIAGQRRYAASRLGPYGGAAGGSALRPGTRPAGGYGFSRFARTAAAANAAAGAEPAAQQQQPAPAADGAGASRFSSPAPLAWTPIRATPVSAFRSGSGASIGSKRKAEGETPGADDQPGSISLLDAQRRLRQRSEAGGMSTERRSWRAGRTPYQPRSAMLAGSTDGAGTAFGAKAATPARPASVSPAPPLSAFAGLTPAAPQTGGSDSSTPGSKATTDTARRILETLNELDQTIKCPSGGETPFTAPSPPPTESLGGGLPKTDASGEKASLGGAGRTQKRRVTFAELTGTPSPGGAAASAAEEKEKPAKKEKVTAAAEKEKTADKAPALPAFNFKAAAVEKPTSATPLFAFAAKPAAETTTATAASTPAFSLTPSSAAGAPSSAAPSESNNNKFVFSTKPTSVELNTKVKAAVKGAPSSPEPSPTFLFGKQKKASTLGGAAATTADKEKTKAPKVSFGKPPLPSFKSADLEEAARIAQEASKSPLPAVDFSDEEDTVPSKKKATFGAPAATITTSKEAEKTEEIKARAPAAVTTGGWDMSFLLKNKETAAKATEAAAKEIEGDKGGTAAKPAPVFSFGAPASSAAASEPAKLPAFLASASTVAAAASSAATLPAFLAPASTGAATTTGFTFGATATTAAPAAPPAEEEKAEEPAPAAQEKEEGKPAAAPVTSGWGDAFLKANQAAAAAATEAAAKEAEGSAAKSTAPAATFNFGAPASEPAATAIKFSFGAPAPASEPAATTEPAAASAPAFNFGPSSTTTPAEPAPAAAPTPASAPAFTFGATTTTTSQPAAAEPSKPAETTTTAPATGGFVFGSSAASQPAFTFGATAAAPPASSTAAPAAAEPSAQSAPASTGFVFRASPGMGASTSAPAQGFVFGAQPSSTGAAFSFGGGSSSAPAAPSISAPASNTFGFGASTPAAGSTAAFTFGASNAAAPASTPASGFTFGAAPAAGGFGFGTNTHSVSMEQNDSGSGFGFGGSAAPAAPTGGFGASASSVPAFGGFGGASSTPAFGGSFGASPAPAFGAPSGGGTAFGALQPPPTFGGAPQQQPGGFGAPQPSAFGGGGFSGGAQQPPPFGNPQAPMGQMIPNPNAGGAPNPFGGGMPGGGFSLGTTGNSQSEGRRKVKVRRPGRK